MCLELSMQNFGLPLQGEHFQIGVEWRA